MKKLVIETIEYDDGYYLTIGTKSPWDNRHIKIPVWVAVLINNFNQPNK